MKVREAIAKLSQFDPEAELVSQNNEALWLFDPMPGYWDGRFDRLIIDPNTKYYNIKGIQTGLSDNDKVKIRFMTLQDVLGNDSNAIVLNFRGDPCEYGERLREEIIHHEKGRALRALPKISGDKCQNRLTIIWDEEEPYLKFKKEFFPTYTKWRKKDLRCYGSWYDSWYGFLYYDVDSDMIDEARYTATAILDSNPDIRFVKAGEIDNGSQEKESN